MCTTVLGKIQDHASLTAQVGFSLVGMVWDTDTVRLFCLSQATRDPVEDMEVDTVTDMEEMMEVDTEECVEDMEIDVEDNVEAMDVDVEDTEEMEIDTEDNIEDMEVDEKDEEEPMILG